VVSYRRQPILCDTSIRHALRAAIFRVQTSRPFTIDAWVLLPDHLHCIRALPEEDADYSTRWNLIKRDVSVACATDYKRSEWLTASKTKHRESTIWQRRFWEHQIRDEDDFKRHVDYMYFNPVKHGLCTQVIEWPYSTFHRDMVKGHYPTNWGGNMDSVLMVGE